jgi:hypothetical protein
MAETKEKEKSYLATVKDELEELFGEAFEAAWRDVVEPALKQSYKNGLETGRAGSEDKKEPSSTPRRRRFLKRGVRR